jgi:hypothetical protein
MYSEVDKEMQRHTDGKESRRKICPYFSTLLIDLVSLGGIRVSLLDTPGYCTSPGT